MCFCRQAISDFPEGRFQTPIRTPVPRGALWREDLFSVVGRRWLQGDAAVDVTLLVSTKGRVLLAAYGTDCFAMEHRPLPEATPQRRRKFFLGRSCLTFVGGVIISASVSSLVYGRQVCTSRPWSSHVFSTSGRSWGSGRAWPRPPDPLCSSHFEHGDCQLLRASGGPYLVLFAFWVAQTVKHLPATRETGGRSLGQEDAMEKEMATHSSILAWRIQRTEDPGRLQSKLQRARCD